MENEAVDEVVNQPGVESVSDGVAPPADLGAGVGSPALGVQDVRRERSTIQFPYGDIDDAASVAKGIYELGGNCGLDQLAHKLGHKDTTSGTFGQKVGTAQIFGVIEKEGKYVRLTELGQRIVQPEQTAQAKVDSFLLVPLYKRVFDNYRGNILPPDKGLENFLGSVGVVSKQADKARQALQRSALQAGFFSHGTRTKLIIPVGCLENGGSGGATVSYTPGNEQSSPEDLQTEVVNLRRQLQELQASRGKKVSMPELPDAIVGVLTTLPLGTDEKWTADDLTEWTQMFEVMIKRAFRDKIEKSTASKPIV